MIAAERLRQLDTRLDAGVELGRQVLGAPRLGESARCGVRWSNTLKGADGDLVIDYGVPAVLDWPSAGLELQPLESIVTQFNVRTTEGRITPVFRDARG